MIKDTCLFLIIFSLWFSAQAQQSDFYQRLSAAALEITKDRVIYDPAYYSIPYPDGDVPAGRGVCTDVVIRTYRKLGIDLQKEVHQDMKANFGSYPKKWRMKRPDTNIDHRRVPNLQKFFTRKGKTLAVSDNSEDYKPGDIFTWKLPNGLDHIGIVVNKRAKDGKRYLIVHNIGGGQVVEDCLFAWKITGHYQYM